MASSGNFPTIALFQISGILYIYIFNSGKSSINGNQWDRMGQWDNNRMIYVIIWGFP